jgi:hypothetical protein
MVKLFLAIIATSVIEALFGLIVHVSQRKRSALNEELKSFDVERIKPAK